MSDGRSVPGSALGVRRGLRPAARLFLLLHTMRRHVDFCRTAAAICPA